MRTMTAGNYQILRKAVVILSLLLLVALGSVGCTSNETNASELENKEGGEQQSSEDGDGSDEAKASNADGDEAEKGDDEGEEEGEDEDEEEAVPVEVVELKRGEIESVIRFTTNLEAENAVQVFAQASRLVTELLVEEGDTVARNEILVRLQDAEQKSVLAKARGQLDQAKWEHDRQMNLFAQELVSEQSLNDAAYQLEQLQIAVSDANRELSYTAVRAPIAGIVTSRLVKLGDHITLNQHLFDIVDFDSIVALLYVPERELARVHPGQTVRLFAEAWGDTYHEGTVDRIAPVVDPRTGTVKITVAVPRFSGLLPGMYVESELITAIHPDALLVPKQTLVFDADQMFVFKMDDDSRVERILVRPLLEDKNSIEPSAGLEEGDRVVIAGQAGLKNGALVRVVGEDS